MKPIVLIVEDDENDQLLLRRAFAKAAPQAAVEFAGDGEQAIACLERTLRVAMVILDLKLPRKSGFEVLQWMRATPGTTDLPVIVRSSSSEPSDLQRAYALGCNSYVVKDVSLNSLFAFAQSVGVCVELRSRATVRLPLFGI